MAKITPTTNDGLSNGQAPAPSPTYPTGSPGPNKVIMQPHEPLRGEVWPPGPPHLVNFQNPESNFQQIPQSQLSAQAQPLKLKVALIGTAPSSRMLAPFNDPTWEIWVCSPGNQGAMPRINRWFEIHGNLLWPENKHYGEPYINWLKQQPFPIYMQNQELVPNATPFPKDAMVKRFGRDFFTSSFAWMMAFAISEGAVEISLYGIDMASRDEYILQRPGFYFFKYHAEQLGIKVSAPNESDIMQPPGLYGYSEVTPFGRKLLARDQEVKGRLDAMRQERAKLDHNITYLEGAVEDLDYIKSIWGGAQS
jgi:hypothetical protein